MIYINRDMKELNKKKRLTQIILHYTICMTQLVYCLFLHSEIWKNYY